MSSIKSCRLTIKITYSVRIRTLGSLLCAGMRLPCSREGPRSPPWSESSAGRSPVPSSQLSLIICHLSDTLNIFIAKILNPMTRSVFAFEA